jgi:Carboxypeptidase regulatory-like domain
VTPASVENSLKELFVSLRRYSLVVRANLLALSLFIAAVSGSAQTFRGGINGLVSDPTGQLVAGAAVTAVDTATAQSYSTISSSAGEYSFSDLPLGTYDVQASKEGFQVVKVSKVIVQAGSVYSLPLQLSLASATTTVDVTAAAISVDPTTATQTSTLATQSVQQLPLNGRDFTQLLTVTPGYAGFGGAIGSVNGARLTQINWQIEGSDNNDLWHNIPATNQGGVEGIAGDTLPIDSIEEFTVVTQGGAEEGRNPGGTVNLVIKSGTNQVHGSAYYYNRNEALEAKPIFTPKDELRNQQWGASTGGPIIKDKTFFFASFEHQGFVIGSPTLSTEPSQAYQTQALALLKQYNIPVNPVAVNLLNGLWPASALTGPAQPGNYFNPGNEVGNSFNSLLKLDHAFNEKNRLSVRGYIGDGVQTAPTTSNLSPYFEVAPMHTQNWALIFNTLLTTRLTNQLTFGVNTFKQTFSDFNSSYDPIALGLNTGVTNPILSGSPNILIGTFDPTGPTPYSGRVDVTGHLDDALSYVIGKHQFRFGGEARRAYVYEFYGTGERGTFRFNGSEGPWAGTQTNNNVAALADFLAGYVYQSDIVLGDPNRQVFMNSFDVFAQDNWQVTRKLNINLGLRYDYISPIHDAHDDLSAFIPGQGVVFAGQGIPFLYPRDWGNVGPRVGFAYSPFSGNGGNDFVIRGGFGIFYDTVNIQPFLNNPFFNGGPSGAQGNPAGSNPVGSYERDGYTLPTDGSQIFPSQISLSGNAIYDLFSVSQNFKTPVSYNYNLNIQKSLAKGILLQVGYVGSQGRHLLDALDINAGQPGAANLQASRPYFSEFPNYGNINQLETIGDSNYNGLQAILRTSSWHGLSSQFSYTWSHSLDDGTDSFYSALPQNNYNLRGDYGNSDFDQRHNFTGNVVYDIPALSHGPRRLVSGWKLSSELSFRSGLPFSLYAANDFSGTGENYERVDQITSNPYAGVSHSVTNGQPVQWVNPAAFANPAQGTFGTEGRNSLRGPGFSDVDFAILKDTAINERVRAQFRVEIFNLFNRVNLANPAYTGTNYLTGPSTAIIATTNGAQFGEPGIGPGEPFNVQVALKILF